MLSRKNVLATSTSILVSFLITYFLASPVHANGDMIGYWKFDEGSGTTALDSSGNGLHGTIFNATYSSSTPDVEFSNPSSLYFNPATDGRVVTTPASLNGSTEFTMSGWMYPISATSRASLFGQNDIFEFGFTDGDTIFCYTPKGEISWDFNPGTFLNNWHLITCLATPSQLIMYIDGVNVAQAGISAGSFGSSGYNVSIGAGAVDGGSQGPFSGYIDDVRMYSRGLTPDEMETLGGGGEGPTNDLSITSLSPADNATGVALDVNLVATFSESISTSTGAISIYKASDDSLVESIPVDSSQVSKNGTELTINPTSSFTESTEYYVWIPATAIQNSEEEFYGGTVASTTWSFTTGDFTDPSIINLSATPATTSATINWTTTENASTKVTYGFIAEALVYSTSELNTSPRVTEHEVVLADLLSCTMYAYAAVSTDGSTNTATSSIYNYFTTAGCTGDADPGDSTHSEIIDTDYEHDVNAILAGDRFLTVNIPSNAADSQFAIQIKELPKTPVLNVLGRPDSLLNEVGGTVFDIKAIINGDTILDSFNHPVTITYEYNDIDVVGSDETTFWFYHYTGGEWVALNDCTIDTAANTISCTTPSFSIFGLFGSPVQNTQLASVSGGISLSGRINQLLKEGEVNSAFLLMAANMSKLTNNRELLIAVLKAYIAKLSPTTLASTGPISVRDLGAGAEGQDVVMLQKLLIAQGYSVPSGPTGYFGAETHSALASYQEANNISPAVGYMGFVTRQQMKESGMAGLWW